MTTTSLQLYSQQQNGVIYANPADPDFQVRFKHSAQPKLLDGVRTTNYITEIIATDLNSVTVGSKNLNDAVSVRVRVSGAIESMDRLKEILSNMASQLPVWAAENVLTGFQPTTAPIDVE